ncbi:LysR substrate-binding domain-containing protein [Pseudoduganella namucuonensis]|uniref:Transcriptional regulator, LysR family n=1 Tax=Pseudoduganella namucuonensis TaxID=1035707 RepID=A0A1I7G9G1_9BURK|nr:LysR substrate-binding domain-containing protein [Pseudoduganella namucuonensis]SFU45100.1 transcriptional regulator, LysR family [Pseudoduganella namucuonensis]
MPDPRSDRFVRSHLKTRHLVLLVELGRHGSILHAAQAANLTQPAASKLLAELEHALNVQLFERLPRGVVPTWYGEVMIRRAGAALAEMDSAHQEVMELLSGLSGRVSIGTVLTPSAGLVTDAVKLIKSRNARLQVSISVDTSKLLTERLRAGELDLVIGRILDSTLAAELHFEPLTDEPHSLIAGAGHPLAGRNDLTLADLASTPWVLPPAGSILRDRLTTLFLSQGLEPPVETIETLALPVVTSLLTGSRMVAALPEELVRPYLDAGLLIVLPYELGLRMDMYGIITRRQHRLSPGAEAMHATLREVAARRYPAAR